jgi:hypothetical protein
VRLGEVLPEASAWPVGKENERAREKTQAVTIFRTSLRVCEMKQLLK